MTDTLYLPEGFRYETKDFAARRFTVRDLERAAESGTVLEGIACRCDGDTLTLHVDVGGIRGIIPREEAAYVPAGAVNDIAIITRVGRPVCFRVLRVDTDGEPTAILSRRSVQKECFERYVSRLVPGDLIPVRVTHTEPFGAFVDVGCGIVSLASVDSLSVSRISHPRDRVTPGERLTAVVRAVDRASGRIYMSLRELLGTWEENAAAFTPGETVPGIVRSVENYGIFVELSPNLAGLAECRPGVYPGDGCAVYVKSLIPERMKVKLVLVDTFRAEKRTEMKRYVDTSKVSHLTRWRYSPACCPRVIETVFN